MEIYSVWYVHTVEINRGQKTFEENSNFIAFFAAVKGHLAGN